MEETREVNKNNGEKRRGNNRGEHKESKDRDYVQVLDSLRGRHRDYVQVLRQSAGRHRDYVQVLGQSAGDVTEDYVQVLLDSLRGRHRDYVQVLDSLRGRHRDYVQVLDSLRDVTETTSRSSQRRHVTALLFPTAAFNGTHRSVMAAEIEQEPGHGSTARPG
ncbi:hypothetical protein GBF38_009439, partial [Nibea albiflora]